MKTTEDKLDVFGLTRNRVSRQLGELYDSRVLKPKSTGLLGKWGYVGSKTVNLAVFYWANITNDNGEPAQKLMEELVNITNYKRFSRDMNRIINSADFNRLVF